MYAQIHRGKKERVRCQRDKETERDRGRKTTTGCRTIGESNIVSQYKAQFTGRGVKVFGLTVQH